MPAAFPKGFPQKEYRAATTAGKDALRARFGMRAVGESPAAFAKRMGAAHKAPASTKTKKTKGTPAALVPSGILARDTDAACEFIRAWNTAKRAEDFIAKHGKGNKAFWIAATHRASFLRSRGIKLKKLVKAKLNGAVEYDWDKLKMVAAESLA